MDKKTHEEYGEAICWEVLVFSKVTFCSRLQSDCADWSALVPFGLER